MKIEFEVVFAPVNRDSMREILKKNGAKCTKVNTLMKRVVFENPINPVNSFVRVRDEGGKISCCLKTVSDGSLHIESVKELETEVQDFGVMKDIFSQLGIKQKAYQETYREIWELNNEIEVMIDEWPGMPPFIEIEGEDEDAVKKYSLLLGFDYNQAIFGTVDQVYKKITGIEPDIINNLKEITFENPPIKNDK